MVAPRLSSASSGAPLDHAPTGSKRKATAIASPVIGRVTRRSLAASAFSSSADAGPSTAVELPANEGGGGQEATGLRRTKRARRSSPSRPAPAPAPAPFSEPQPEASSSKQPLDPIDPSLADAPAPAAISQAAPLPRPLPYPIGLTPYRFECVLPHQPPPTPGDPHAPDFRPFNPRADDPPALAGEPDGSKRDRPASLRNQGAGAPATLQAATTSSAGPALSHSDAQIPPAAHPGPNSVDENFQFPPDFSNLDLDPSVDFMSDPTYASIAALLSASQLPGAGDAASADQGAG